MIANNNKMNNSYDNKTRQFPTAFGGQRRGGGGGYNNRGGGGRRYQEVRYPAPVKKEEPKTVDVTSEMNFPALGGAGGGAWGIAGANAGAGTGLPPAYKSFAALASDWKETEEAEEARIAYERAAAEADNRRNRGMMTAIFTKSRLHTESTGAQQYYEDEYDEEYIPQHPSGYPEDAGWNMVDNAKKRATYPPQYADRGSRWEEDEQEEDAY